MSIAEIKASFVDTNYIASYDIADLEFYQKQADLIAEWYKLGNYEDKINEKLQFLDSQLERTRQGQYVAEHKPTKVGKKYDLVVQNGLVEFAKAIISNTGRNFNHIATGDGTAEPMLGDFQLEAEKARMALTEHGSFKVAAGSILRFGAFFLPGHLTHIVCETGVFSAAVGGIMMNHALFSVNERITHRIFEDFYGVALLISMSSV